MEFGQSAHTSTEPRLPVKILLVVDGSDIDQRAIKRVMGLKAALAKPPQVILTNVVFSLPQRIATP